MDNHVVNKNKIDLSKIDWNKLTVEEFIDIEKRLHDDSLLVKRKELHNLKISGDVTIKLRGKGYVIPAMLYHRLKNMKSEKPREKLIQKIMEEYTPLEIL